MASKRDPPDLCLLSKEDYRYEPPTPSSTFSIFATLCHQSKAEKSVVMFSKTKQNEMK
jgi:hypothetical protein